MEEHVHSTLASIHIVCVEGDLECGEQDNYYLLTLHVHMPLRKVIKQCFPFFKENELHVPQVVFRENNTTYTHSFISYSTYINYCSHTIIVTHNVHIHMHTDIHLHVST